MSDDAISILRDILSELRRNRPLESTTITLADFCEKLGRSTKWGYQQIKIGRIFPDKSGKKPWRVPISQLKNFQ